MTVYNTLVGVVANLEASSPDDAARQLSEALRRVGFEPYEGEADRLPDAFESESDAGITRLPA